MKRLYAYIFLGLFVLNVAGTYSYFGVRLYQIRLEMRAELKQRPTEELTLIRLTAKQFHESRVEEDEMEIDGKMYDIAKVVIQGNDRLVYCLHDADEDNLLSLANGILKNATHDKKPVPPSLLFQLLTRAGELSVSVVRIAHAVSKSTPYFLVDNESFLSVTAPPPRG